MAYFKLTELKEKLKEQQAELKTAQRKFDKVSKLLESIKPPTDPDNPIEVAKFEADKKTTRIAYAQAVGRRDQLQEKVDATVKAIAEFEERIATIEKQRPAVERFNAALAELRAAVDGLEDVGYHLGYQAAKGLRQLDRILEHASEPYWTRRTENSKERLLDLLAKAQNKSETQPTPLEAA